MGQRDKSLASVAQALGQQGSALRSITQRARMLQRWEKIISDKLPEAFQGHWGLARLDRKQMVLMVDSPAWASRLRYMGSQVAQLVADAGGPHAQRVIIKVGSPAPAPKAQTPRVLSEHARRCILSAAEAQQDPKLRAALFRLGRRG